MICRWIDIPKKALKKQYKKIFIIGLKEKYNLVATVISKIFERKKEYAWFILKNWTKKKVIISKKKTKENILIKISKDSFIILVKLMG